VRPFRACQSRLWVATPRRADLHQGARKPHTSVSTRSPANRPRSPDSCSIAANRAQSRSARRRHDRTVCPLVKVGAMTGVYPGAPGRARPGGGGHWETACWTVVSRRCTLRASHRAARRGHRRQLGAYVRKLGDIRLDEAIVHIVAPKQYGHRCCLSGLCLWLPGTTSLATSWTR